MENWLGMKEQIGSGALHLPVSRETRLQMMAVDDIGAFVAKAFEHAGQWQGRAYELAGDELSFGQITEALGRASNRDVNYVQMPWDQFEAVAGHELTMMYRWFEQVGYDVDIAAVRAEYPQLTSFERWLAKNWHISHSGAAA